MDEKIILGRILQVFISQGYAQHLEYNKFGFIKLNKTSVVVSREKGKDTPIPFSRLLIAINGYKENSSIYEEGPTALRELGLTHITSPIFSLLHLLPKEAYKI